jgi:hypothetical protein
MEEKIIKASKLICAGLLILNLVYFADEFLKPETKKEMLIHGKRLTYNDGSSETIFTLENGNVISLESVVISPRIPGEVLVYYTPIYHGIKGFDYELFYNGTPLGKVMQLGDPSSPRMKNLIFNSLTIILILASLLIKRMEFSVGLAIFVVVFTAVNYWVLH